MRHIVVIEGPQPIMTAAEARAGMPALSDIADPVVTAWIAAAAAELDGPTGWLGRALGRQTLELQLPAFPARDGCRGLRLPLPPIVEIVSVTYFTGDADVVCPGSDFQLHGCELFTGSFRTVWPGGRNVRIRYKAGYDEIPPQVKVAVQLRVGEIAMQFGRDATLKKEVVEGVGSFEYDVGSDAKRSATSRAVEALLGGLRVLTV